MRTSLEDVEGMMTALEDVEGMMTSVEDVEGMMTSVEGVEGMLQHRSETHNDIVLFITIQRMVLKLMATFNTRK